MSLFAPKRSDAATPSMLLLSMSLHVVAIIFVGLAAFSPLERATSNQEQVTRVSLIDGPSAKPNTETISRGPVKTSQQLIPEPLSQEELPTVVAEAERKTVSYEIPQRDHTPVIPLKKRSAPPRRSEAPKPEPSKKKETKTVEKKDETKDFLEKRLSQIRSEVEKKRAEQSASREIPGPTDGARGNGSASRAVSEDFIRWFEDVRGRINSHWSLLADNRKMEKSAVIGVKLSDDGRLIEATVDATSGDPLFDKSAMRAVFLASPFPPVPPQIREKIRQAGGLALRFSPGGIQ